MRARTWGVAVALVLVALTAAYGAVGEHSLLDEDCSKLRKRVERLQGRLEKLCPTATPAPTRSPSPTATYDCPSGHFVVPPDKNPRARAISQRLFAPGQAERFCVTLPGPVPAWPWATLSSTNHANMSCGDLQVTLTSPSGVNYYSGGTQPMSTLRYEEGRWSVVVRLNDQDPAACVPTKPWSLYVSW